jgi:hypothetical protein
MWLERFLRCVSVIESGYDKIDTHVYVIFKKSGLKYVGQVCLGKEFGGRGGGPR